MNVLWVIVSVVGGIYIGVLGMCLLVICHKSDEQAIHILKETAEAMPETRRRATNTE